MNLEFLYVKYFTTYLSKITNNKDCYFISFCDVDPEIFEQFKYNPKIFGPEISIVYIKSDEYDEAVRLRNNIKENKIVILTTKSVKNIDSLKHFSEFEMFPEDQNIDLICDVINILFNIKNENYKKFFQTIIKSRKVTLPNLLKFAINSINTNNELENSLLNSNLNLLGFWKAGATSQLIGTSELRKIIRCSDSSEIMKRLDNIVLDKQDKNSLLVSQKREIQKLIFNNDYTKLMELYDFGKVKEYFSGKKKSVHSSYQEENYEQIIYSFQHYELLKDNYNDLDEFENNVLLTEDFLDEPSYINYIEAFNNWDKMGIEKDYFVKQIESIYIQIEKNGINIKEIAKKELLGILEELRKNFETLYDNIYGKPAYPFIIKNYIKQSIPLANNYFKILKVILKDIRIQLTFSDYGLSDKFFNLFLLKKENKFIMPFYHPIFICYFASVLRTYEKIESLLNEDEIVDSIMEKMLKEKIETFPISLFFIESNFYQFNNYTGNIPFYIEFVQLSDTLSKSSVDPNILYKKIENYIIEHPYLNEIQSLVIGDLDLETINNLENKVKILSKSRDNLLDDVVLTLLSENIEITRSQIDSLISNDKILNNIEFKILNKKKNLFKQSLSQIIERNQIVFILDSQLLYIQPKLIELVEQKNELIYRLQNNDIENYIENSIDDNMNDIALIMDTIQNIFINGNNVPARWNFGNINSKTFGDIINEIKNNREINIVIFSSNLDFANNLLIDHNLYQTVLVSSKGRSFLEIDFAAPKYRNKYNLEYKSATFPSACIYINDFLETVLNKGFEELLNPIWNNQDINLDNFYLRFSLIDKKIKVELCIPKNQSDFYNIDEFKSFIMRILTFLYQGKNNSAFITNIKRNLSNYMFSLSNCYGDSFLCLYIYDKFIFNQSLAIIYTDNPDQNSNFDCYTSKQVCDFINQKKIYDEATIFMFNLKFENIELTDILEGACMLREMFQEYEDKVKKIIIGVKGNE